MKFLLVALTLGVSFSSLAQSTNSIFDKVRVVEDGYVYSASASLNAGILISMPLAGEYIFEKQARAATRADATRAINNYCKDTLASDHARAVSVKSYFDDGYTMCTHNDSCAVVVHYTFNCL